MSIFKHPIRIVRTKLLCELFKTQLYRKLVLENPQRAIDLQWIYNYGKWFPWNNPQTLNEKIQWLQVYSDTTLWSVYSDKYEVRNYIQKKGYKDILVKCYGVWNSVDEIDYNSLPDKFVIKCTHDSGSTYIVNKEKTDFKVLNQILKKHLETPFGYFSCEPHYLRIKPRIIAEELLENQNDDGFMSSSLVDYKIWCFNGKPYIGLICYDRHRDATGHMKSVRDLYNLNPWKPCRDLMSLDCRNQNFRDVPQPKNLERLLSIAEDLATGFPEVRVDFYNINGRIFFGELTFTSNCGRSDLYSNEALLKMGDCINLDIIKQNKK